MLRKSYLDPVADMSRGLSYSLIDIGRADPNVGGTFCGKRRKLAESRRHTRKHVFLPALDSTCNAVC